MKTISIAVISALLFLGCGGYKQFETYQVVIFKYRGNNQVLIFSNETEFIRTPSAVSDSGKQSRKTYYIHIDDSIERIDSLPIRPDTILTLREDAASYHVYRYSSILAIDVYRINNLPIRHVDVYFEKGRVKFLKVQWDYA